MRKNLFFLIIALLLFSLNLTARQPAVDPVMGISIDEEKPIDPKEAKGYKWKSNNQKINRELAANQYSNEGIKIKETIPEKESSSAIPLMFILFLTVLPVIIWFTIVKGTNIRLSKMENEKLKNNLKFLSDYQNNDFNDDDDDEDDNLPKAS